jgi:ABC-2 type transport system permease protein
VATDSATAGAPALGSLPDTIQQVLQLARFQLRNYLRSRRFILMMLIVAVIGALLTGIVGYYQPARAVGSDSPVAFFGQFWGQASPYIVVFAGIIYGGDAIAGEFQNKTGYFLMGLPVRRVTVYAGKYLAALAAAFGALLFYLAIVLGNGIYYFGGRAFVGPLASSFGLATLYLLAVLGATFLFSSLFKTSTYAVLVVAVLFLFGFSLIDAVIEGLLNIQPWFVIAYAQPVVGSVFNTSCTTAPGTHTCSLGNGGGPMITVTNPTLLEGALIMLGYFLLTTLAGLVLFEREEFT